MSIEFEVDQKVSWSSSSSGTTSRKSGVVVAKIPKGGNAAKLIPKLVTKHTASVEFDGLLQPAPHTQYIVLVTGKDGKSKLYRPLPSLLRANSGRGSGKPGRPYRGRASAITAHQMGEIRKLHKDGVTYVQLGEKFGVSYETIRRYLMFGLPKSRRAK